MDDFDYKPSSTESLFSMDKSTSEIQRILRSKTKTVLDLSDIAEIVDADLGNKGNFSLIRVAVESREKYGGNEMVIAGLRRMSKSPSRREEHYREMMEHMLKEKKLREMMFIESSEEALRFIKE